jgi:DNA-binding NarL/FixJ family response regulator
METEQTARPGKRIRVFVSESNVMAAQLIEAKLKKCREGFSVQGFVGSSSEILQQLKESKPEVAIISADLPDGRLTGFNLLHQLRDAGVDCPIVVLLNSLDRDLVIDAIRAGARGIFPRTDPVSALAKCICAVSQGQLWINNEALEFLLEVVARMKPFRMAATDGMARLTHREQEISSLVAEGMRNEDIALKLRISEHTVRNYLSRVFEKLGVSSRVELVLHMHSR